MKFQFHEFMEEAFPFKIECRDQTYPFHSQDRHAHDYFQICYIRRGSCLHEVNGKSATLGKGDLFAIPPDYEHRIAMLPGQETDLVLIDFMPFLLDRHLQELDTFVDFAFIEPFAALTSEPLPKLNLSHAGQLEVEGVIDDMIREEAQKRDGYRLLIKADLLRLLVVAGREYGRFMEEKPGCRMVGSTRKGMERAIAYIDLHYREELTLKQAAAQAAVSATYFSSMFKLLRGMTFIEYVTELRLREACRLLLETDGTVEEISRAAGFNHLTHFHRVFKKHTGLTPQAFRKRSLGDG